MIVKNAKMSKKLKRTTLLKKTENETITLDNEITFTPAVHNSKCKSTTAIKIWSYFYYFQSVIR